MKIARATVLLLVTTFVQAQAAPPAAEAPPDVKSPTPTKPQEQTQALQKIEVFNGPTKKKRLSAPYPEEERARGSDGWVNLNFMIDPEGKPYEIMVTNSTGNKALEQAAIRAAEKWEFEPATLAGVPIDSSYTIKVNFVLSGEAGANPQFVRAYDAFRKATKEVDRQKADAALARLKVKNLYEDAFYNLARYDYARLWGTEAEQFEAIQRAMAEERNAGYLPKPLFAMGLEILLNLQIKRNDFAGALVTWSKLKEQGDSVALERWESKISEVNALRNSGAPYAIQGEFGASTSWYLRLYRKKFQIDVTSGRVAEIKLRCDKRYVFFRYEPDMQYAVADKYGNCSMELIGDPGTEFSLVQS